MTTSDNASGQNPPINCRWCGLIHGPLCPSVKAIEYDETGLIVRRVEFHGPQPFNPFGWLPNCGDPRLTAAAPAPLPPQTTWCFGKSPMQIAGQLSEKIAQASGTC